MGLRSLFSKEKTTETAKRFMLNPTLPLERQVAEQIYNALQGPVVGEVLKQLDDSKSDAWWRSNMEGHSLKVAKELLPDVYELCNEVKDKLGYTEKVDFYITGDSTVNAFSVASEKEDEPNIVNINSGLFDLMTRDELRFVIGHELGHLINKDTALSRLIGFVGPLNPGIGDSGGIDDGEEIGGPIFGGRTLSMTNVSEPVSCEWTDSHGNVLGNNEYLCIAMNASEEYTLTVTSLVDGEVASVSKAVQPMSYFKNVTSDNGNVLVSLVCPSIPGMSMVVRSAISESICQRYGLPDGNSEVILNTSILDNGVYLISLYYNNQLLETKQIIK